MGVESTTEKRESVRISYNPQVVVDFFREKGSLTTKELGVAMEWNSDKVSVVMSDLRSLKIVLPTNDWVVDEKELVATRKYRLTDDTEVLKNNVQSRTLVRIALPKFSEVTFDVFEDLSKSLEAFGLKGAVGMKQMLKDDPEKFTEIVRACLQKVLEDKSGEDLRGFSADLKLLTKAQKNS